jgi:hypothetical protein
MTHADRGVFLFDETDRAKFGQCLSVISLFCERKRT